MLFLIPHNFHQNFHLHNFLFVRIVVLKKSMGMNRTDWVLSTGYPPAAVFSISYGIPLSVNLLLHTQWIHCLPFLLWYMIVNPSPDKKGRNSTDFVFFFFQSQFGHSIPPFQAYISGTLHPLYSATIICQFVKSSIVSDIFTFPSVVYTNSNLL